MTEAVTAPAPAAPAAPAPGATAAPEAPASTPEQPPERTFTQKELNEIVEGRLAKQRKKYEPIEQERNYWRDAAIGKGKQPEQLAQPQPKADDRPKRDDFETYEDFIRADARWEARQEVDGRLKKEREEQERNRTAAEQKTRDEAARKRLKELSKDMPDFDEVMAEATASTDLPVARLYMDPVMECENPALVLYHLAKAENRAEAERIASLDGHKQAREIWALDVKLRSAPAPKKPSNAPDPITPVGGKTVKGDEEPDPNSKEWVHWRNRQLAKRKGN